MTAIAWGLAWTALSIAAGLTLAAAIRRNTRRTNALAAHLKGARP